MYSNSENKWQTLLKMIYTHDQHWFQGIYKGSNMIQALYQDTDDMQKLWWVVSFIQCGCIWITTFLMFSK